MPWIAVGKNGDELSQHELNVMLDSIKRNADSYFGMGRFRARKKLANGATVVVEIRMPES